MSVVAVANNLTALEKSIRSHVMAAMPFTGFLVSRDCSGAQRIVGTTLVTLGACHFVLLYGHYYLPR